MEDFESVIGLSEIQACKVLASLGYNKIKTIF